MTTNHTTVIDTPDGIAFVQLLSFIGRLKIELTTGLKGSVSLLKAAKAIYGLDYRRKADLLAHLEAVRDEVKRGESILWPTGDPSGPTIGLYDPAELRAELERAARVAR